MRRALLLAWGGNAWHGIEFAIAIGAGLAAGSIALVGFGLDSLVEVAAGTVIVWLYSGRRIADGQRSERRAQQLIAASFFVLAAYIALEAGRDLIAGTHPGVSWVGIGLAAVTAPTLVLHGTEDVVTPFENARILARQVPGAVLRPFDGCGHLFFHERPAETARVVIEHLRRA